MVRDTLAPELPFDDLLDEAARWPAGTEGLLFAPYLYGERTPHADPDARGAFAGLTLRHDRGALVRAALEGVAYGLRDLLELLRELGVRPDVGRISGGGARSALWRRIVASVLDLPLETTAAEQGSAFGAALLAGFDDPAEAVARCVRVRAGRGGPTASPRSVFFAESRAMTSRLMSADHMRSVTPTSRLGATDEAERG